jgi:hypothetical protein
LERLHRRRAVPARRRKLPDSPECFGILFIQFERSSERFAGSIHLPPIPAYPTGHDQRWGKIGVAVEPIPQKLERLNQISLTTVGIGERSENSPIWISLRPKESAQFTDLFLQGIGH